VQRLGVSIYSRIGYLGLGNHVYIQALHLVTLNYVLHLSIFYFILSIVLNNINFQEFEFIHESQCHIVIFYKALIHYFTLNICFMFYTI